jgi:hypothetical protein
MGCAPLAASWWTRSRPCRARMGRRIGHLAIADVLRLDRAVMVFLGLAG